MTFFDKRRFDQLEKGVSQEASLTIEASAKEIPCLPFHPRGGFPK